MRVATGGAGIERGTPVPFRFDGRWMPGVSGDTLASALLANGVTLVGRSFKYHRPRGVFGSGVEEPNALVGVGEGAARQPNLQATTVELMDGLVACSQNRWPSLRVDVGSIGRLAAPLLGAGFYYKTFMGPTPGAWMVYERIIRRAAGLGAPPEGLDTRRFTTRHERCDLLVVGAGHSGLSAALEAAAEGLSVVLAEQDFVTGGATLAVAPDDARRRSLARLQAAASAHPAITLLTRTTVFGAYDHGTWGLAVQGAEPGLIVLHARRCTLATGAFERGLTFAHNDLPGVMLAGAAHAYLGRWGVRCGRRAVVLGNNDRAIDAAVALAGAGARVLHADTRARFGDAARDRLAAAGVRTVTGAVAVRARGGRRIAAVELSVDGGSERVACDLLCVSGGHAPTLQLARQAGASLVWDARTRAFQAGALPGTLRVVGRAAGALSGLARGAAPDEIGPAPLPRPGVRGLSFVDYQNDVTSGDLAQALDEGFVGIEHVKRYTTLGMGTDQGKTSALPGLDVVAALTGEAPERIGATTNRPPFTPVDLGLLAGERVGAHFHLERLTPLHAENLADGAEMALSGLWKRALYYRENGSTVEAACTWEMEIVRTGAAICDVSTLGKIEVEGSDAVRFLERLYPNRWESLAVGKARWGVMLRDDGYVFDDGTVSRLADDRLLVTTTSAKAAQVLARLECLLATAWTDLAVAVTAVTEQWAAIALSGPSSREVLASVAGADDASDAALPFMGVRDGAIDGVAVRLVRVSFTGERSFEIYVPARHAPTVWRRLRRAGAGVYGLEALGALRIEKGHLAGGEMDGRTTLDDLGLGALARTDKRFVGSVMRRREGLAAPGRRQLVGLRATDATPLSSGAVLGFEAVGGVGEGRITSATWSPTLGCHIALALLADGRARHGTRVSVEDPARGRSSTALVCDPHFLDPDGSRMRG